MKYLFIDSATSHLIISIIIDGKVEYMYNERIEKDMSKIILPIIKEGLDKLNLKPKDIDKIFAVTGPGSFTGIRVGLTVAKVYAWGLNIPVIPISSLEVIASGCDDEVVIPLIDARRGYVYAGAYDRKLNRIKPDKYIKLEDIKLKGTKVSYDNLCHTKPQIDVLKVIRKHLSDEGVNPHSLNPTYLKLTEAEEKLREKNGL